MRYEFLALFLVYFCFGLIGYLKFGEDLVVFNYGSILLHSEFSGTPLFFCNFLIIFFVGVNVVLKFFPAKQLITSLLRENQRDSREWHIFVISIVLLF